jgi:hypothetical protein
MQGKVLKNRLGDRSVALIVKRSAALIGRDSANLSGHSLRVGVLTSLAAANVEEGRLQRLSNHKSHLVLRKYVRHGSLFTNHALYDLGL